MANCTEVFKEYNALIKLTDEKREELKSVRNSIRDRLKIKFDSLDSSQKNSHKLEFHSQGSFVMDTIIHPYDDDYDLDDGIYFIGSLNEKSRPETEEFHKIVIEGIGISDEKIVEDKPTCVRVKYVKGAHIDFPIYYTENLDCPELAHTKEGWIDSNPIEFVAWFENKINSGFTKGLVYEARLYDEYQKWIQEIRKKDAQLRRIVRYLKGWGDFLRGEMPPGIIMTILAAENYVEDIRDDVALKETLIKINDKLNRKFECLRPTTPVDEDLFASYSNSRRDYFLSVLGTFTKSAIQAVESPNQKEACYKWQKHLGPRFPCHLAKDEIEGAKVYSAPAVLGDSARSA